MAHSEKSEFKASMQRLARYSKALSHPARIAILEKLAEQATCICGEIVDGLPLAQSTVSQHLKELKNAGLVQGKIDGLKSCYCLDSKGIREFLALSKSLERVLDKGIAKRRSCK